MKLLILLSLLSPSILSAPVSPSNKDRACAANVEFADRKWEMQEIRCLQGNREFYYKEGDFGSNFDFEGDYVIFNCDGSGVYHQSDDVEYRIKWNFSEENKTTLIYTIPDFRDNMDLKVTWENLEISANTIKYTEFYTHANGVHSLARATRTSKALAQENL